MEVQSSFHVGAKDYSLLRMVQTDLSPANLLFNRYRGIKRRGREVNYPSSSSDEFKNERSYTSTPPYVFVAWTGKILLLLKLLLTEYLDYVPFKESLFPKLCKV